MRYAVYYTPGPASELHLLGSLWLGRDAQTCEQLRQPDDRLVELTRAPRRYGFHGTLKPPFRLIEGVSAVMLDAAVKRLAFQHLSFVAPPLELAVIDGFLALKPTAPCPALDALAADCVRSLDEFRAPAGDAEMNRRRLAGLSAAQELLLSLWGYPYVFEEFRFHITLSDRLSAADLAWVKPLAERHFSPVLGKRLVIDAISTVMEPGDGDDFRILARFPLLSKAQRAA